jgi:phage repressor protein C with HTH and peptisase S24 domain
MNTPEERLKFARSKKFDTIRGAAEAFGWHKQNLADHEAGRRQISPDHADKYARALGVKAEWILFGRSAPESDDSDMIPLLGYVNAGAEAVFIDQSDNHPAREFVNFKLKDRLAMRVLGDSMSPRFLPGERLIFGPEEPPAQLVNREVMAQIVSGPLVIKILRRGETKQTWTLQSYNPAHEPLENVAIEWVRPFEAMVKS